MNHGVLTILANIAIVMVVLLLPFLFVLYSDRFRRSPSPEQYATLFAIAALAGVLLFLPTVSIVAATVLLALGFAWVSARYALSGVTYRRTITSMRLFPGDQVHLALELNNHKPLPLSWVSITDPIVFGSIRTDRDLHELLEFSGGIEQQDSLGHALINRAAIGPYQSLVRTYQITGHHRGVYRLGPAHIVSADPFGVFQREQVFGGKIEIIVYPKIYSPDEVDIPFRQIMGDLTTRRTLYEDPILLAGSREYAPGDPLNRMHWKATARTGDLQVRIADPSTTAELMLVVNLNTFQHVWQGVDPDRMEASISVAASLALAALDRGFAVGIRSNGIIAGEENMRNAPRLAPGAGPRQPGLVLEHLARLAFSGRISAEDVLLDESRKLEAGSSILFVTPTLTRELVNILTSRQLSGRVSVAYCGRHAAPVIRGLLVHLVRPVEGIRAVS